MINPQPGIYTLTVGADQRYPNATNWGLKIEVQTNGPALLAFDGPGNSVTTNALAGQWRYFQVNVPTNTDANGITNLLGWDIRLTNVTAGNPQMVVCRDSLPTSLTTAGGDWYYYGYIPWASTTWNSGDQWLAGGDWTGEPYNPDGSYANVCMLAMG